MLRDSALLQAWESGEGQSPVEQALALLRHGYPQRSPAELLALSIGERDALLFELREHSFGSLLRGAARCPSCQQRSLFSLQLSELRAQVRTPPQQPLFLQLGEWQLHYRLPSSHDLRQAAACPDVASARDSLIRACTLSVLRSGVPQTAPLIPELAQALGQALSHHDPQGEVLLNLQCAHCGHPWQALLDIVTFLWNEVATTARQLLDEVDTLARAYGWSEANILALSPARRRHYLARVSHD
ncbi:MAG: hypothetical protein JNM83_28595 [Myxococcales bacterium]|jgi:hypothetical protein|nr:hypothetical protein [Myxococcales bacterium]